MQDLSGMQFGPYQMLRPLGEGGMAMVYRAYQPSVEREVAVKVLPQQYANDPQFSERFKREAKTLATLQHPRILAVFDYGQAEGYSYMVMPLVNAGSLTDYLKGRTVSFSETVRIIGQIADALDYAHKRGLVHRDIKPANVLMDDGGNCLLSDFGIAHIVEGSTMLTSAGAVLGTPSYMSPEQGQGTQVDARSDIYSLGVMLFEMLVGRVPYRADTPVAVMLKHVMDPIPVPRSLNPNIPPELERITMKALAKDPANRFQTAGEFAAALRHADLTAGAAAPIVVAATMVAAAPTQVYGGGVAPADGTRVAAAAGYPLPSTQVYGGGYAAPPPPMAAAALSQPIPRQIPQQGRGSRAPMVVIGILALLVVVAAIAIAASLLAPGNTREAGPAAISAQAQTATPTKPATPMVAGGSATDIPGQPVVVAGPSATAAVAQPVLVAATNTPAPPTWTPQSATSTPTTPPAAPPTPTPTATLGPTCQTGKAEITQPRNGDVLKGTVEVRGTAICAGFASYKFEFVDSRCGASSLCFVAGSFTTSVENGRLMLWDTTMTWDKQPLPNGVWKLRLTVVGGPRPKPIPNTLPQFGEVTITIKN